MIRLIRYGVISKQEGDEFRAFCRAATDNQLREIVKKERLAGERDTYRQKNPQSGSSNATRQQYAAIAEAMLAEREAK